MNIIKKIYTRVFRIKNFKKLGVNTEISNSAKFFSEENISIGDHVFIGHDSCFYGFGGIDIGRGSILAHNLEIMTRNHVYDIEGLESIPYGKGYDNRKVVIEENVWIGSNVKIVPGVTIGEGSVIGMGSVVTKDVPKCAVIGGNPAKIIKYRNKDLYYKLKEDDLIYLKMKNNKTDNM